MKFRWITFMLLELAVTVSAQTYLDSTATVEARVQDLLSRMTLEEKIGQMTQADRGQLNSTEDIGLYFLGSILSGGGSVPESNTPNAWADMVDAFQARALQTRLRIPLLYGIDAVHGNNNVYGAVIFPHQIGMGCTWNPELVREAARVTALEVAGTGIHWTFAPCVAVPRDERWGRTYEGFGETPEIAALLAPAAVKGFQGDSLSGRRSILGCSKHYLGDGGTTGGVDQGNAEMDESTLRAIHLPGYITALEAGVGTVMASFSSWNGQKMHGHHYLLTDVLKTELGFQGFVVSDWNGIDQLEGDYRSDVKQSILAGIDMVMAPSEYASFFNTLKSLVENHEIAIDRIDDAVSRILRIKFALGLFERPFALRSLTDSVGCWEHRQVARQCVRESLVLLKKENGILPLSGEAGTILVAGSKADNIGYQCGGWTITWQGSGGNITPGTTIRSAIEAACAGASVVYSEDGSNTGNADVAVVVIGETPYAEMNGDRQDLSLSAADVAVVRRIKNAGIPTVVILLCGRPMILDKILHFSDCLFTAWLPGTEGGGVADILFGSWAPKGLLTHSWPRSMAHIPLNWGDSPYRPLYPYKHGIVTLEDDGPSAPPLFHSALLLKNGAIVEAAFSKPMNSPGAACGFEIRVNGTARTLTDVRVKTSDPSILELVLEGAANAGDALLLSYTPGTVTAQDGGALAAFDSADVYNYRNEGSGEQAVPGIVEAENFSAMSGIVLEPTQDAGGGSEVTSIDATDWMDYQLAVSDSGNYQVSIRYAAETRAGRVGLVHNGQIRAVVDLPASGGSQVWATVTTEISLDQGLQTLKVFAFIGGFSLNWLQFDWVTSVAPETKPVAFSLAQNYPNPFNHQTLLSYRIPGRSSVDISVYDLNSRKVAKLVEEVQEAGEKTVCWDASGYASGLYLVMLRTGGHRYVKKIMVLK